MDTAKVQQIFLKGVKKDFSFGAIRAKVHLPRLRGLQAKLILPYLILTVILALIGLFIITMLVVNSESERFNNNMLDASRVANDNLVNQEKNQLNQLRLGIFTEGMAQAMSDHNADTISTLVRPLLSSARIDVVTTLDLKGSEILTLGRDAVTREFHRQQGQDFSGLECVQKVLHGIQDEQGDKFVEIVNLKEGAILFTSAPVVDENGNRVGAMLVGTYMNTILLDIKKNALSDVLVVDSQGALMSTTLNGDEEGFDSLVKLTSKLSPAGNTQAKDIQLNKRSYTVAYSPLTIRGQAVGWLGVIKNSEYKVNQVPASRDWFIILFSLGTIVVIVIGVFMSRSLARPILKLRSMSVAVAAGDLNQSIGLRRADEIGELADAFDTMTQHLRERTEEAERLYQESLQRNKELAEINARLEATQLQLIQSEKLAAIGQLTAGIVHDVKNPFAVIMGMSEVLGEDEQLDEATRHGLKVIRESAIKGNTIVSDLLKFARQSKPEMRTLDMRETVQTAMRLTAYLTRRFNTTADLPEQPVLVTYDAQQIEQVLINMIHNAIQAMPNKGSLTIQLKHVEDTAQISVQDTGSGIDPDHLKRIFDPFFTTKPEGEGTGLGLSVSYGIIANHLGRINVESEVGKGTKFTIVLPISQPLNATGETIP